MDEIECPNCGEIWEPEDNEDYTCPDCGRDCSDQMSDEDDD